MNLENLNNGKYVGPDLVFDTMNVYTFDRGDLLNDTKRERDNIVWRVPVDAIVYPIYASRPTVNMVMSAGHGATWNKVDLDFTQTQHDERLYICSAQALKRDYFMHDDFLHEVKVRTPDRYINDAFRALLSKMGLDGFLSSNDSLPSFQMTMRRRTLFDQMMAYELPKPINDANGWVVGLMTNAENVLAHDVEFVEIEE